MFQLHLLEELLCHFCNTAGDFIDSVWQVLGGHPSGGGDDSADTVQAHDVQSLNVKQGADINTEEYKAKVIALKDCYRHCSIITGQIFYLPIRDGETWKITRFLNGVEDTLTEKQFESFITED